MNIEDDSVITPTAPLHAGKRDSNYSFLNNFRTPFKPTLAKETVTSQYNSISIIPLPVNQPVRNPDFIPFERSDIQYEIKNLIDPEHIKLQFALFFFILSLICLSLFLFEIHPEIFLLLSILFFSLAVYPLAKFIKRRKIKQKAEDKKTSKLIRKQAPFKRKMKPSERIALYESTKQNRISNQNIEMSGDLYPPFNNSDRPSASVLKNINAVRSVEAQIDSLASETLKKLNIKLSDFHQYTSNLKNFIQKNIISKIVLTSDKPYVNMMLDIPGYSPSFITERIRALTLSPFLAGHTAENGDNQIVLHILSVWLSYLMTGTADDKRPELVFSQKYLILDGKEPKIESGESIYFIANKEYNSFYVISSPLKSDDVANEATSVERFYTNPGKDSMYSTLAIFFYIVKMKFDFLLDGADLEESPFYMSRIFEPHH